MNKQSIIGLVLIGVIFFGFTWYSNKQQTQYRKEKAVADSIAQVRAFENLSLQEAEKILAGDSAMIAIQAAKVAENAVTKELQLGEILYGASADASTGVEEFFVVENELAKYTFSNKGGRIVAVELKNDKTYGKTDADKRPLMIFNPEESLFDISFFIKNGYNDAQINSSEFYFVPQEVSTLADNVQEVVMRLNVDSLAHVDFVYTIAANNYMMDFDVRFVNMDSYMVANQGNMELKWGNIAPQSEKGYSNENNNTTIAYHYPGDSGIELLGMLKNGKSESLITKVQWIGFKRQFFSSIIVADNDFVNADVEYATLPEGSGNIKRFFSRMAVPYTVGQSEYGFNFYFGPNKFSTLKKYDLKFERLVPLGGSIIGWINRLIVIPVFDLLGNSISSYGIIILILTIILKLITLPLTYKSHISSAKMRLLKPEIDKISEKFPKQEDALKKQQATMEMYKKAGVNPMGGCLPMLIQMPILIAMFRFFPASIELRGESFLWADDLSSYDSILNLPFNVPFYGDHVSLFTLLMAVSVFFSSRISYNQTAGSAPQMAGMKFMMLYMMPVMLLLWFNNYSSGLSYYYLMSNILTIGITYGFRKMVDEDKIHFQMKENAKKPVKKTKWQQKYDQMLKQQQELQKSAEKRRK